MWQIVMQAFLQTPSPRCPLNCTLSFTLDFFHNVCGGVKTATCLIRSIWNHWLIHTHTHTKKREKIRTLILFQSFGLVHLIYSGHQESIELCGVKTYHIYAVLPVKIVHTFMRFKLNWRFIETINNVIRRWQAITCLWTPCKWAVKKRT